MLDVLVVLTAVLVGLIGGWWLRGADPRTARPQNRDTGVANESRDVARRLRELTRDVAADFDQHKDLVRKMNSELHALESSNPKEILSAVGRLIESNERMQRQLHQAEARLENQAQQIEDRSIEARTDPLTQLANRRAFDDAMQTAHDEFLEQQRPTVVMLIDIDHFKDFNDTYGHQAGDEVLRGVGRVLVDHIPSGNLVARYGGEEFAVIFPDADIEAVEGISERARIAIGSSPFNYEGLGLGVTASAGLAQFTAGEDVASLIARADEALYASKESGRNCGHFHTVDSVVPLMEPVDPSLTLPDQDEDLQEYETGVSTREEFFVDLRRRLSQWKEGGAPLCTLFVRVDALDQISDRYGEENYHAIRRALTLTLKSVMREMDHVARFDGQTLSLLLPGCTLRGAISVAERLRQATALCELPSRYTQRRFTISTGVAEAREDESEVDLAERARQSLEAANAQGQDCTFVHDGQFCHLVGAGQISML
jgi:diguanylate cyclase